MRQPAALAGQLTRSYAWLIAAALGAAGCYRYAPVPIASVSPQENVRVRISDAGASRLVDQFGIYTTQLDGQIVRAGRDSVTLVVPVAREYQGVMLGTTRQTLLLDRPDVLEVDRRQFSRARTALVTAGVLAGFGALAAAVTQLDNPNPSSSSENTPPPPSGRRGHGGHRIGLRIGIP